MTVAALFHNPMTLSTDSLLWLMLPLSISVAIVYKTLRTNNLRRLPLEILGLIGYVVVGVIGLGVGLWFIQTYCL
jgi:hypothetical protein